MLTPSHVVFGLMISISILLFNVKYKLLTIAYLSLRYSYDASVLTNARKTDLLFFKFHHRNQEAQNRQIMQTDLLQTLTISFTSLIHLKRYFTLSHICLLIWIFPSFNQELLELLYSKHFPLLFLAQVIIGTCFLQNLI